MLVEADWKGAELSRAVVALGVAQGLRLGYDRTSVAHWLSGSRPRPPVPELVAAALTRRLGRAVSAEETGLTRVREVPSSATGLRPGPDRRAPGGVVHHLITLCREDADPVRRAYLARTVYTPTGLVLPHWPPRPTAPSPPPVPEPRRSPRTRNV
ncbi:hypothetical protein [Streptomyces sp. NPDC058953]|uniref:hypothetical protein n=1 Tax=unclassified Streptomyces TaxID=2593676 RepID=UPI003676BCBE